MQGKIATPPLGHEGTTESNGVGVMPALGVQVTTTCMRRQSEWVWSMLVSSLTVKPPPATCHLLLR